MRYLMKFMLAFSLLAVIAPLPAEDDSAAKSNEGKAKLIGSPPEPVSELFELRFTAIDGKSIIPREIMWLEPGTHIVTARVPARYTRVAVNPRRKWDEDVDFELTVEPNKTYRVRGKYNRNDFEKPFELVIEETEA